MIVALGRREFISSSALAAAGLAMPGPSFAAGRRTLPAFYGEIERRTFNWFWETVNRKNGLIYDRWPTQSFPASPQSALDWRYFR